MLNHLNIRTIILLPVFLFVSQQTKADESDFKDIVLLNSYHSTFKWTADITEGVLQEFSNNKEYRVFVEYMDAKRFQSESYIESLNNIYSHKYNPANIDGIIISDNNAFDFYLKYGRDIWGDTPVSFCGINNIHSYDIDTTRFKGINEKINIDSTLQIIKTLQPDLESLMVISDSTTSGIIFTNQFTEVAKQHHPELKYTLVYAESPDQLAQSLQKNCPKNKAIYLLSLYINRSGFSREMKQEADLILENCKHPVYSNWDFLFGNFITGGVVITGTSQGVTAAKTMKEMLSGNKEQKWLTPTKETLALDYKQLNHNGLNYSTFSGKAVLFNKPVNHFERFRKELIIITSILGFLVLLIMLLLKIINKTRKTEKRLLQSESRLEMALEGANEGLWDVDFTTGSVFLSQKFATLLKYNNPNEIDFNTSTYSNLFHPADRSQVSEAFQMHKTGYIQLFHCEARLLAKTGHFIWFSIHGKIIEKDEIQNPLRMVGTVTEIQSQKEFEHQLKEAKEKAEESDRLKSAFLANMSHEIRTPMNAILGFTDILMSDVLNKEDSSTYLNMIKDSGENLLNIINDIIDISKIESGQLKIKKEEFDLHTLLKNLKEISQNLILQKNKNLKLIINPGSEDEHFFIKADPYRLQQILLNLLTNAIKFTDKGKIELGYRIKDQQKLEFFVNDTGQGIAPKHKKLIFERFRQVDETSIRKFGGTGLGLAITKSLVTMMNGEIWFTSELGRGTEFNFFMPCEFKSMKVGVHF